MLEKLEIKIVQYYWGDHNHSYAINRRINEAYCRRHGYGYVAKTFVPRDDRAWRWSKIPAIREELHDCDFLLYLDADAFFYSHELRIEEELIPLLGNKQIMMTVDCVSASARQQSDKPETGVILVRNSEKSAKILRIWDESSERPGMEYYRFDMQFERDACFQTICKEHAKDVGLLEDYHLMNGANGMYIRHLTGMTDEHRFRIQDHFLKSRAGMIPV